jgi:Uncharacterized protein conserved in bacteria (DUF2066)
MRTFIVSLIVALIACAQPAAALRQVRVYEATVSSQTDAAVQAQAALRQVLVRTTGSRDAANDPALAGVLAQAQAYVLVTRPPASGGGTQIVFDAAALERDIVAAGRTIWSAERPLLIVILTGGPASGAFETRRQVEGSLDSTANRRGQPIRVSRPEAMGLPADGEIATDAALIAAQRLGGDAVLIGYGDGVTTGGPWRWNLTSSSVSETWSGSLEEGVHASADIFARNSVAYAAMPDLAILVEIEGVPTLKEYARVTDILGNAGGVRSVQLAEAAGSRTLFSVVTRGGADALQSGLSANGRLERIDPKSGGSLAFRYRP